MKTQNFIRKKEFSKPTGAMLFLLAALLICVGLSACNTSDSSSSGTSGSSASLAGTFTEPVKNITPNLATAAAPSVMDWSYWNGDGSNTYSVLYKLFNPDAGVESIFGPVATAEQVLDVIESSQEMIETDGTYEVTGGEGENQMDLTLTVTTLSSGIIGIPYFEADDPDVTRQIVMESADGNWKAMVAYDLTGDDQSMVVHSRNSFSGVNEYMVFWAQYDETTQDLQVQTAMADENTDAFKIHYVWKGNLETETFAFSQHTNAAWDTLGTDGMWKVMGGGSIAGDMAYRAVTNDDPTADYYVVVTMDSMIAQEAPAGYPAPASDINSSLNPVEKYIDEFDEACIGWLADFPQVTEIENLNY